MSANFTIKEGGTPRAFSSDKLRIRTETGGVSDWVPEIDFTTGTLSTDKNGSYDPSSDGYYAYSEVTVNVQKSNHVSGKETDGNDHTWSVDDDGNLVDEKVPSKIFVTVPPSTILYNDGDAINYSGMEVTAYDANNESMGVVPFGELVLPKKNAYVDDSDPNSWTDSEGINSVFVRYEMTHSKRKNPQEEFPRSSVYMVAGMPLGQKEIDQPHYHGTKLVTVGSTDTSKDATLFLTRYNGNVYALRTSGENDKFDLFELWNDEYDESGYYFDGWQHTGGTTGRTPTSMFTKMPWAEYLTDVPESLIDPEYKSGTGMEGSLTLPVQWPRTGDGKVLETSIVVHVSVPTRE